MDLYRKYRPRKFSEVVGQPQAVKELKTRLEKGTVPQAILFCGESGTGKTTLARILAKKLGCDDLDFCEVDCGTDNGIEMVRSIKSRLSLSPMDGPCRIWLIDECQQIRKDGQSALLKMLEDTPSHVYLFLATTDPGKLLKTVLTRCAVIKLKPLGQPVLKELLQVTVMKEGKMATEPLLDKIAEVAAGSARKALVILGQVLDLPTEEERLEHVIKTELSEDGIKLARVLFDRKATWPKVAEVLRALEGEDAEQLRYLVLGYARSILLSGGPLSKKAMAVIEAFGGNFYDSKHAGLAYASFDVISGGNG